MTQSLPKGGSGTNYIHLLHDLCCWNGAKYWYFDAIMQRCSLCWCNINVSNSDCFFAAAITFYSLDSSNVALT